MASNNKTKYVYITYDPLLEQVICAHDKPNKDCVVCGKKEYKNRDLYQLEEYKLKIRTELK